MILALLIAVSLQTSGASASQPPATPEGAAVAAEPTASPDTRAAKAKELPAIEAKPEIAPVIPAAHRIASANSAVAVSQENWTRGCAAIDNGLAKLRATQTEAGAWMAAKGATGTDQKQPSMAASTAVTALGIKAFAQAGHVPSTDSSAKRARDLVRSRLDRGDGKFNPDPDGGLGNYVASAVASGLAATDDPADRALLETTVAWLTQTQWDQSEGISPRLDWFGGSGYGKWGRPDLSNTQMMLDALHDSGVSADDPAVQRAVVFLTRTQNLPETNAAAWAKAGSGDGGFVYTPANGGESFASDAAGEGRYGEKMPAGQPQSLRSYGSMTYAGFKSLLYAGLSRNDPRVRAALEWIRKHWTLSENPGLGQQGYYYYLHAMARALNAAGVTTVTDSAGVAHNWRDELIEALASRQRPDGSWVNATERWEESDPDLCTIYSLLALEEALKPSQELAGSSAP